MKKVVGFGACVFDTLINCDTYPKEDSKKKAESIFVSGGGPVGNALVVMSKLGIKAEVIGAFGGDAAGQFLLNDFKKYGVCVGNTTVLKDRTSFTSYIVLASDKATRTCVFERGTVPDEPKNLKLKAIDDAFMLHLDGNYLNSAVAAAKHAKEKGVLVSLDAGGIYNGIEKLLPLVDILIPSAEFALGITERSDILSAMQELNGRYHPKVLVVTDGKNGGYYMKDGKTFHYDSIKVKAVDTNGAGDTFHGAFLAAYCDGKDIKYCCDFASKVAAFKCENKGLRTLQFSKNTFV